MRRFLLTAALTLASLGAAMAAPPNLERVGQLAVELAQPCEPRCGAGQVAALPEGRRQAAQNRVTPTLPTQFLVSATPVLAQHDASVRASLPALPGARPGAAPSLYPGRADLQLSADWALSTELFAQVSVNVALVGGVARLRYMF